MAIEVLALKCPECSARLSGFEEDRLFFCPACKTAWELAAKKPVKKMPVSYARAVKRPDNFQMKFFLPFYLFRLKIHAPEQSNPRVRELTARLNKVYIPAFRMMRESYFGELGLIYTELGVVLEEDVLVSEKERSRLGSAFRGMDEVEHYIKYYPLLVIDKREDVTGRQYDFESAFERIWAVPFFDLQDKIQDGILGRTFPSMALETLSEFRELAQFRG
jgi:hypothetical protein